MIDLDLRCTKCKRYLGLKGVSIMIAQVRCPSSKCKHLNSIKVITASNGIEYINYRFED